MSISITRIGWRFLFFLMMGTGLAFGATDNAQKVLLTSDLHFDPFAEESDPHRPKVCDRVQELIGTQPQQWKEIFRKGSPRAVSYNHDTNYWLLESALDEMNKAASDASLVVITGDLLAHEFRAKFNKCLGDGSTDEKFGDFVRKTMIFLAGQIQLRFQTALVLPVLGNNDSVYGDYVVEPNGKFLADFKEAWADRIGPSADLRNMAVGGFYSAIIGAKQKTRVIATNTTLWSARYEPLCGDCKENFGNVELAWLRSELQKARDSNQSVWILGHIPPGIDVRRTLTSENHLVLMYKEDFNRDILEALRNYAPIIQIGFFGHTHNNEFRVLNASPDNVGLQLIPSVSPDHGNNPAFMVLTTDMDFLVQDYTVHVLDLSSDAHLWKPKYAFQQTYGQPGFSGKDLFGASTKIADRPDLQMYYAQYFFSGSGRGGITKLNWRAYRCGITNLDASTYSRCMTASGGRNLPGGGNELAIRTSLNSPEVMAAYRFLIRQAESMTASPLRTATLSALDPETCIEHRKGLTDAAKMTIAQKLRQENFIAPSDADTFPGGIEAGLFPPVLDEQSDCPHLPQPVFSAPGSTFGKHHSYPGGLVIHEANNEISAVNLSKQTRTVYGGELLDEPARPDMGERLAAITKLYLEGETKMMSGGPLERLDVHQDMLIAAPIWHDWAKAIVFQWNEDGTEFKELPIAGTGGHHILGLAETMRRKLSPELVITQAAAHGCGPEGEKCEPSNLNEKELGADQVVRWISAAAIVARIDPVAQGYLIRDNSGRFRLPPLPNADWRAEYFLHNLSDADWHYSEQAVASVQTLIQMLSPSYGFDSLKTDEYNNRFRNPVLSMLTAERLWMLYVQHGLRGVDDEIHKLCENRTLVFNKCSGPKP